MKINSILKTLPLILGSFLCFNANAGVKATSYLEINNLFVEIDLDGDGIPDVLPQDLGDYITISGGTREGNTTANWNGTLLGDAEVGDPTETVDAALVCVGPSCGGLGLTNNGQSLDLGNLVHDDTMDYSTADQFIEGSAIGDGANSFTYADVGISQTDNIAAAGAAIFNNILTSLTIDVLYPNLRIRFVAIYDAFIDAAISPDITADNSIKATASAEASFNVTVNGLSGGTLGEVLDHGFDYSDLAFDIPGFGDLITHEYNDEAYIGAWSVDLLSGIYQAEVVSDSDVQASLIPEPSSIALIGLAMLGLASRRRKA